MIAVALCVIAFRETAPVLDDTGDLTATAPGAQFTDPVVQASIATVVNSVDLKGTIAAEPSVEVPAPATGTAVYFSTSSGTAVNDDDPIMTIRTRTPQEPRMEVDDAGNTTTIPQADIVADTTVYANADGEITYLNELNDDIAEGDVIARIDPKINYISATVPPEALYRLLTLPTTAQVTITNGPAPFDCTSPQLVTATTDGTTATTLRCEIPAGVTVFPGLEVSVEVISATAEDAVVVPLTAVRGSVESGSVWLVVDGAEPVETPVALGLSDGSVVQVTQGLSEGDTVLEFVPGSPAVAPDGGSGDEAAGDGAIIDPAPEPTDSEG